MGTGPDSLIEMADLFFVITDFRSHRIDHASCLPRPECPGRGRHENALKWLDSPLPVGETGFRYKLFVR